MEWTLNNERRANKKIMISCQSVVPIERTHVAADRLEHTDREGQREREVKRRKEMEREKETEAGRGQESGEKKWEIWREREGAARKINVGKKFRKKKMEKKRQTCKSSFHFDEPHCTSTDLRLPRNRVLHAEFRLFFFFFSRAIWKKNAQRGNAVNLYL